MDQSCIWKRFFFCLLFLNNTSHFCFQIWWWRRSSFFDKVGNYPYCVSQPSTSLRIVCWKEKMAKPQQRLKRRFLKDIVEIVVLCRCRLPSQDAAVLSILRSAIRDFLVQLAHVFLQFQWCRSSGSLVEYFYLCDFSEQPSLNDSCSCIFFFVCLKNKCCKGTCGNFQLMSVWSGIWNNLFRLPKKGWRVVWQASISLPAGVSVFYPQHEFDPTQFDMSRVWCCGRGLAVLLVLSEQIRGSEDITTPKHSLHL